MFTLVSPLGSQTETKIRNRKTKKAKVRAPYTTRATGSLIRSYLLGSDFRKMSRHEAAIVDNVMRTASITIVT